jgi:hypothetical protein
MGRCGRSLDNVQLDLDQLPDFALHINELRLPQPRSIRALAAIIRAASRWTTAAGSGVQLLAFFRLSLRDMKLAALAVRNTGNLFRDYFEPSRVVMKGSRAMTIHDPGPMKLTAYGLELNLQEAEPFKLPAQDLTGVVNIKPRYRQRRAVIAFYV